MRSEEAIASETCPDATQAFENTKVAMRIRSMRVLTQRAISQPLITWVGICHNRVRLVWHYFVVGG